MHKCHGGPDSLVTARESFEVARRFFFGNVYARLSLIDAEVKRGFDRFFGSEIFFGVSIKPRAVDFDLFHQSAEAENTYGPFHKTDLSDDDPAFGWAGDDRLIWEGWFDTTAGKAEPSDDLVLRLDVYVGERDSFGVGFSDNVIFHRQLYVRAVLGLRSGWSCTRTSASKAPRWRRQRAAGSSAYGSRIRCDVRNRDLRRPGERRPGPARPSLTLQEPVAPKPACSPRSGACRLSERRKARSFTQ